MTNEHTVGNIRRDLWSIIDHYEEALEPPRLKMSEGSPGTQEAPPPVSVHILDVRREAHADLLHYARIIQFEVTDIEGGQIRTRVDGDDPIAVAHFIITWVERMVGTVPAEADRCETEIHRHAWRLRGLALGLGARRFTIGTCPEHGTSDMGERVPCPGNLRAVLRKDDDTLPSGIECDYDVDHQWSPHQWMQLGRRINDTVGAG